VKQRDSLKRKRIDTLDYRFHILLLALPLALFMGLFMLFAPPSGVNWMALLLVCLVYLLGYSLSYYLHQGRISRLWHHLEQVVNINDATYELVHLSSQYHDEHAFLDALLHKAVSVINGAEMGSIIRVDPDTHLLEFESCVGIDISRLKQIRFTLEQSFEYRLTKGKCDRVVVIDDMRHINAGSTLTEEEQQILLTAAKEPIRATLSSPIHIDGKLYAMLNLDSSHMGAFSDYDRNLVSILTHEAANAISLYQKSRRINQLARFDSLTGLYNRRHFEDLVPKWQHNDSLGSFLVLIDMDNLKKINDQFGHTQGDLALKRLGDVMNKYWGKKQLLARFGGDEFVALCQGPEYRLQDQLQAMTEELADGHIKVGFSYGIVPYAGHWEQAFTLADAAMYRHKGSRKRVANL